MNWINTKDQLPEPGEIVIVIASSPNLRELCKPTVITGFRFGDEEIEFYSNDNPGCMLDARWAILTILGNAYYPLDHITHWQPLPKPPM